MLKIMLAGGFSGGFFKKKGENMDIREIKKIKYNGKKQKIKIVDNLFVFVLKNSKVYKFVTKVDQKQIEATIDNINNISVTKAKQITLKLKSKIANKDFKEAREIIRAELAKKTSKKDKEIIQAKVKQNEQYLLKNIIQEFLQTRNRQEQNRIQNYIIPILGEKDVRKITKNDIIDFFKQVKKINVNPKQTTYIANKMATIKRLKNNLNLFYKFLYLKYDIEHNPVGMLTLKDIESLLGDKYVVKHFTATTNLTDIQDLYKTIKELKTDLDVKTNKHKTINIYTKYALQFLMLTALRNGTLRRLKWDMINWDKKIIDIPAEITKTKKDFRLPLTDKMLKILEDLKKYGDTGLIFKGRDNKIMSENTLNAKIKKLSGNKTTAHGIRSAFATILKEQGENPLYIEEQLMHVVENKVGQAYTRTDYLEQRRDLLEKWGELINPRKQENRVKSVTEFFKSKDVANF